MNVLDTLPLVYHDLCRYEVLTKRRATIKMPMDYTERIRDLSQRMHTCVRLRRRRTQEMNPCDCETAKIHWRKTKQTRHFRTRDLHLLYIIIFYPKKE